MGLFLLWEFVVLNYGIIRGFFPYAPITVMGSKKIEIWVFFPKALMGSSHKVWLILLGKS